MPIKLGTTSVKIPYSKACLGDKLIYQAVQLIPFTSCPFPTSWTQITQYLKYKSINEYGEWTVNGNASSVLSIAKNAFDNNSETRWVASALGSDNVHEDIWIECPENVSINPAKIYLNGYSDTSAKSNLLGFNSINNEWEIIYNLKSTRNPTGAEKNDTTDTIVLNNNMNFYNKFKIEFYRYSSSYKRPHIYDFKIEEGVIKIE